MPILGPPGVLGILGEWLFIFRELGSTGNYFRGSREQAHIFGQKNKGKASILFDFLKISSASAGASQTPLHIAVFIPFRTKHDHLDFSKRKLCQIGFVVHL